MIGGARRLWWLWPILATGFAFRHSWQFGLLSDAQFLIADNLALEGPGALWANLTHDYFWSSSGTFLPYWRPLTKASWVLEQRLFHGWAGGFHLVQVAWHLLGVAGITALARFVDVPRGWAATAGLAYGVHPAAVEPVCMVMARSDVTCATGAVWALASWIAWRRTRRWGWGALHALALVVAVASKETGIALVPVVTLAACIAARQDSLLRRLLWATPAWLAAALLLVGRRAVLGQTQGAGAALDPWRIFLGFGRYVHGMATYPGVSSLVPIPRDPWLDVTIPITAALGWLAFAGLAWLLWRGRRWNALVLLAWIPASLAPVLLVAQLNVPVSASRYALSDRWALPAVAVVAVVLALLAGSASRAVVRRGCAAVVLLWAGVALAESARSHGPFRDDSTLTASQDAQYLAMPERLRTLDDHCDFFERQINASIAGARSEAALGLLDRAPPGCPPAGFALLRLMALVDLGRFAEARPVAERLLDKVSIEGRYHATAYYHAGLAFAGTGEHPRAEKMFRSAAALGSSSCNLWVQLARTLVMQGRLPEAVSQYERAAACKPDDPRPLLAVATLWFSARQPGRARAALDRAAALPLTAEQRQLLESLRARR